MSSLIHRLTACLVLVLAGYIFPALPVLAEPDPATVSRSTVRQSTDPSATGRLDHQATRATQWGLDDTEWQRYRTLMQGIRGSVSPATLSPIEVLGIHARNAGERRRYAGQWARMMREDAGRILAFQRAYDEARRRLYPDSTLIDVSALAPSKPNIDLAQAFAWQPGDRVLFFAGTQCPACDAVLERMLGQLDRIEGLDLYLVDVTEGEESRIREWAAARQINPLQVRQHRITLNIDAGALERVLAHTGLHDAELPVLIRKRGHELTPLPASRF